MSPTTPSSRGAGTAEEAAATGEGRLAAIEKRLKRLEASFCPVCDHYLMAVIVAHCTRPHCPYDRAQVSASLKVRREP